MQLLRYVCFLQSRAHIRGSHGHLLLMTQHGRTPWFGLNHGGSSIPRPNQLRHGGGLGDLSQPGLKNESVGRRAPRTCWQCGCAKMPSRALCWDTLLLGQRSETDACRLPASACAHNAPRCWVLRAPAIIRWGHHPAQREPSQGSGHMSNARVSDAFTAHEG